MADNMVEAPVGSVAEAPVAVAPTVEVKAPTALPTEDRLVKGLASTGNFRDAMDMVALNTPQQNSTFSLSGMIAEFKAMISGKPKS